MRRLLLLALLLLLADCGPIRARAATQRGRAASPDESRWRWEPRPGIEWVQTARLTGRVLLPDGMPAAQARVFIGLGHWSSGLKFAEVAADRSGRFQSV